MVRARGDFRRQVTRNVHMTFLSISRIQLTTGISPKTLAEIYRFGRVMFVSCAPTWTILIAGDDCGGVAGCSGRSMESCGDVVSVRQEILQYD